MEPVLLIHGYSAESRDSAEDKIRKIYGPLPTLIRQEIGADVHQVDLSRYISLEDGITIDDISAAMDRSLREAYRHVFDSGFNVIVHSTGALVARNWLRRYWDESKRSPIRRIVHLAGANFGSGWAHVGRSQLAKWYRAVFQGAERGLRVLHALELGSDWTIEMHREVDRKVEASTEGNRPLELCMVGSQRPDEFSLIPVKYATEPGADGVVRVAASNLNYGYIRFRPSPLASELEPREVSKLMKKGFNLNARKPRDEDLELYEVAEQRMKRKVPFSVVHQCSHTYKASSILGGEFTRDQVLGMLKAALECTPDSYANVAGLFEAEYASTLEKVKAMPDGRYMGFVEISRKVQYNQYAQVIFRIFDQYGRAVPHFNIFFNSIGGSGRPDSLINERFKDGHPNKVSPNTITFYLSLREWDETSRDWVDRLSDSNGCVIEIDATEHGNDKVAFLPFRYRLSRELLGEWLKPNQTTIVDVELQRVPTHDVFTIVSA